MPWVYLFQDILWPVGAQQESRHRVLIVRESHAIVRATRGRVMQINQETPLKNEDFRR